MSTADLKFEAAGNDWMFDDDDDREQQRYKHQRREELERVIRQQLDDRQQFGPDCMTGHHVGRLWPVQLVHSVIDKDQWRRLREAVAENTQISQAIYAEQVRNAARITQLQTVVNPTQTHGRTGNVDRK